MAIYIIISSFILVFRFVNLLLLGFLFLIESRISIILSLPAD